MNVLRCVPLMLLIGLAGCEATTFVKPPLAEAACDPQLVGDWLSIPDPGSNDVPGEGELRIDKTCKLVAIDHKKDKSGADTTQTSDATQLHVGHDDGHGYIWVDSAWAFRFAQTDVRPNPGDLTFLRYDARDDRLALWMTDDRAIAHRIIDGDLKGEMIKTDDKMFNRITGAVSPEQLRSKIAFQTKPARFVRQGTEPSK